MTTFLIGVICGMVVCAIIICTVLAKDPVDDVLKKEKIRKAAINEDNKDVASGLWKALEIMYTEEEDNEQKEGKKESYI